MSEISLALLQGQYVEMAERVRILRAALLDAKHQLVVTQIMNPGLQGERELEDTIERIQRAMRYET